MIRSADLFFVQRFSTAMIVVASAVVSLVGCGKIPDPEFRQNMVLVAQNSISQEHQDQIGDVLEALYGTPDEPFVLPETGLDLQKITMAAGPVRSDETGAKRGLFREHCAHCHGVTGDGMGPTAAFLKPYPRDYRQGVYKFKSTASNYPPTHNDLMRILNDGITGTAMPSFKLLPADQVEALAEYVKYLSFRGQTEIALIDYVGRELSENDAVPTTHEFLVGEILQGPSGPMTKWQNAESQVTKIPQPPADFGTRASIEAGKQVFYTKGACVKCHGPTALGDGQLVWDVWNEPIEKLDKGIATGWERLDSDDKMDADARENEELKLKNLQHAISAGALPPRMGQPRNLRQGIFRGGREPFEIFYRLHNGILASAMPGIATTPDMSTDDIWHVVDYVLALPYEPGSQYAPEATSPARERL
jgi:mono/diheme cytochrome c family protein